MRIASIEKIQLEFNEYCRRINPVFAESPIQTTRGDDGTSHLEIIDNAYHYIATERASSYAERSLKIRKNCSIGSLTNLPGGLPLLMNLRTASKGRAFAVCYLQKTSSS